MYLDSFFTVRELSHEKLIIGKGERKTIKVCKSLTDLIYRYKNSDVEKKSVNSRDTSIQISHVVIRELSSEPSAAASQVVH